MMDEYLDIYKKVVPLFYRLTSRKTARKATEMTRGWLLKSGEDSLLGIYCCGKLEHLKNLPTNELKKQLQQLETSNQ